ncbi:amino acid ABC transporter substrate-binding protein [Leptolyngbya sp. NK1-12]|uniref:Amino acid ABC transporter substrate-binding protein n=1 Tax=Leptolyngbya sp. NK1-12 TaxID=2547451 RepID=A0AA96WHP8_9CYAN|nr:amino acid ABC transporter substrate-binding protein [Leptolyngbya sp. NK1-12]WNZ21506.1 amino acid ABC transporter substrate-binding protein [Leptolyngbya sp. NK1-12]
MLKIFSWTSLILIGGSIFLANVPAEVPAEVPADASVASILEKVARTGKLVAGVPTDALPFAYRNQAGEWSGYSVDLLERIQAQLRQQLRRPVELELVPVTSANRLSMVTEGTVDIVCGTVSATRSRALDVEFSLGYFITGTQLLVNPASRLGNQFTIGVIAATTNQQFVRQRFPIALFVEFEDRAAGLAALEQGRIDALASDGILLEAMRQTLPEAESFEVVPDQPYTEEEYACAMPRNTPDLQQAVDESLLTFMQGVLNGNPADLQVLDTWFGTVVSIDQQPLLDYFQRQIYRHRQSAPDPESPPAGSSF